MMSELVGHRARLPGHFAELVLVEAVRPLGVGYELRVRRPSGQSEETVLLKMLPQPRLRFLLADDPGAGKTIMAGLPLTQEDEQWT